MRYFDICNNFETLILEETIYTQNFWVYLLFATESHSIMKKCYLCHKKGTYLQNYQTRTYEELTISFSKIK